MCGYNEFDTLCKETGCNEPVIRRSRGQFLCEKAGKEGLGWGQCGTMDPKPFRAPWDEKSNSLTCHLCKEWQIRYERAAKERAAQEEAAREALERDAREREDKMNDPRQAYTWPTSYYGSGTGGSSGQSSDSN